MTGWSVGRWRASVAALAVALLSGCSPWTGPFDGYYRAGDDQPWGSNGAASEVCTPRVPGRLVTWGYSYLPNATGQKLTVDRVRLVDPVGLRLAEAGVYRVAQTEDGNFLSAGLVSGFPPAGADVEVRAVRQSYQRAPGAMVPSTKEGERPYGLALALEPTRGGEIGFGAVEVEYHDETGLAYRAMFEQKVEMFDKADSCSLRF